MKGVAEIFVGIIGLFTFLFYLFSPQGDKFSVVRDIKESIRENVMLSNIIARIDNLFIQSIGNMVINYYDVNGNPIKSDLSIVGSEIGYLTFETKVKNIGNILTDESVSSAFPSPLQSTYLYDSLKVSLNRDEEFSFNTENSCSSQSECSPDEVCVGTTPTCKLPKSKFYPFSRITSDKIDTSCQPSCPSNYNYCAWRFERQTNPPDLSGFINSGKTDGTFSSSTSLRCYVVGYDSTQTQIQTLINYDNSCSSKTTKTQCESAGCCYVSSQCRSNCLRLYGPCPSMTPSGQYVDFCLIHDASQPPTNNAAYLGYDHALKPGESISDYMDKVDAVSLSCTDVTFTVNIQSVFTCPNFVEPCQSPIGNISAGMIGTYMTPSSITSTLCPSGGGE